VSEEDGSKWRFQYGGTSSGRKSGGRYFVGVAYDHESVATAWSLQNNWPVVLGREKLFLRSFFIWISKIKHYIWKVLRNQFVYISVTIFECRDFADTQIAEFSGQSLLNSTNVCFNSFLWSLPSAYLQFCFAARGERGAAKRVGGKRKVLLHLVAPVAGVRRRTRRRQYYFLMEDQFWKQCLLPLFICSTNYERAPWLLQCV